ncbi:MAG: thioredoxin-related protein [Candidatus Krumholzibacteriia bacterium]|jgi:thioredoxin-related protein
MNELRKKTAWAVLVALLVGVGVNVAIAADKSADEEINYLSIDMLTYREAKNLGRGENKPVFLHFTAPFTGNTGVHMKNTLEDTRVIKYLNKNFASATINISDLPSLARKHHVDSAPTILFLDSSGKTLTSIHGSMSADKLLSVGQYVVEKAYESISYEDWSDKQELRVRGDGGD